MLDRLIQKRPVLLAAGLYAFVVSLAFWPFWAGGFLSGRGDTITGYPVRAFAAQYFRTHGGFPEWNPYIFGGMPFLANTSHGDTFYPTFLLRLIFPVDVGISLGFLVHIVLAGTFMFLFLRALRLEWGPAFIGGAAYMFSGQIVSLVSPGHDGKLFVSALLPLALMFLYQAVTRGAWRRYLAFGVVVGFSLVSPHFQMTYYLLMAAGFFWAFLVFLDRGERATAAPWWRHALGFGGGLAVGFALAAIQILPFLDYLRYSARGGGGAAGAEAWAYHTGWSMPPEELINVLWPAFSGMLDHYWGRNPFKLHSEYLGVATLILATFGFRLEGRRRMAWFFVFLAAYGALFALGGYTPFYRLPYHLLPMIKLTRAPSMIFFLTSFSAAALAALGAQTLAGAGGAGGAGEAGGAAPWKRTPLLAWAAALGAGVLLAGAGFWQGIMRALADPARQEAVRANADLFLADTVRVLTLGGIVLALLWWRLMDRFGAHAWAVALGGLVLFDLWSVERRYILFGPPAAEAFAPDGLVRALHGDSGLYRVLPGANHLMLHDRRSVLGYSGNEVHRYDELLGGKNEWSYAGHPALWSLLGVRYLTSPSPVELADLEPVGSGPIVTHEGPRYLYRYREATPFAYLVPLAVKVAEEQQVPVMLDPRFDPRRFLIVPQDASVGSTVISSVPDPLPTPVRVSAPRPGTYSFELAEPAAAGTYLFVSENWHPGWSAAADGRPATVVRAQHTLMAVPLPAGTRGAELVFRDPRYRLGRLITLLTALTLAGIAGHARWARRRVPESTGA